MVTISIVNTSNCRLLRACLASVRATALGLNPRVVVVDNASTDGSAAMVRSEFPEVALIAVEERAGYSANHNRVLKQVEDPYALVLNEDTELLAGALAALIRFLEEHPRCGAVGPLALNTDGSRQPSCNRFPQPLAEAARVLLPARWAIRLDPALPAAAHADTCFPDWIGGMCMLLRRAALAEVGALDDRYYLFFEEVDLCRRLRAAGWDVGFTPEARIRHHGGASYTGDANGKAAGWLRESRRRYFRTYHGALAAAALGAAERLARAIR